MDKNLKLELSRRDFLKMTSIAGLAGTGIAGINLDAMAADPVNF